MTTPASEVIPEEVDVTETQPPLTSNTPSFSFSSEDGGNNNDTVIKDFVLWRRKKLSGSIIVAATATWVLMEVYQFKFLTVISWLAISLVTSTFLYANIVTIFGKEPPNFLRLELKEETALRMGNRVRVRIEEAIRWLLFVSTKERWPVFMGVLAALFALSYIGTCMDFLTFTFIGILVSTTVPMIYLKNEEKIKRMVVWLKAKYRRSYEVIDEKAKRSYKAIDENAIKSIKSKIMNGINNKKEKKIE